jgi:hypothetical protein
MKYHWPPSLSPHAQAAFALVLRRSLLLACLLLLASGMLAQDEVPEPPPLETGITQKGPDTFLPKITAALEGVTTPDVTALAKVLQSGEKPEGTVRSAPSNSLVPLGDLDGDGVPEMLLKWAIPDVVVAADVAPAPDSEPLWSVYLLSWNGAHWKASRLMNGVEDFTPVMINLGPPVGRGIAVVIQDAESQIPYPAVFQFKDHAATLLWDAQADDSRYEPLLQGHVSFEDHGKAAAEMIVTGRANPGFLQVDPNGHRGFSGRAVYHWDGKAFAPAKTEYTANQDYTVYRFISALHLHDYRSAYALVDPAKFLDSSPSTLDAFQKFIQDKWPEFLEDAVFEAPEPPAGSPGDPIFVLAKPGRRDVYHPVFSSDGKFLLTGLTRTQEAAPAEP